MIPYGEYYGTDDQGPSEDYPRQLINHVFGAGNREKVLDVGCGNRYYMDAFEKRGYLAHGIDAQAEPWRHNVDEGDIEKKLPYHSNSFDIVFTKSVIEHLRYPENLVAEAWRVLKKGGTMVVITPDWKTCWKGFYDDYTHRSPMTVERVKTMLEMHEFKDVQAGIFYQFPQGWGREWVRRLYALWAPFTKARWVQYSRWPMILAKGTK